MSGRAPDSTFVAMGLPWRTIVLALGLMAWANGALGGIESADVTLDYVAQKALDRARKPFHSPRADLPEFLRADALNYDKYREIRFRPERALWASDKLPFRIEFFHPGYLYEEPVHVFEFFKTHLQEVRFVSDFFDYGSLQFPRQVPANTGYAGFKILYPLNQANAPDELGSFLGASYYRLLGKGQRYGPSARGLALDCGETDRPEEFPIFTDWWLGKPETNSTSLRLFALVDSVSCVGAYQFDIRPGDTTVVDIEAALYLREADKIAAVDPKRKPINSIGLAPLTSMFWFGPASDARFDDYRTAVHDSDGLLMQLNGGEMLWRPLDNPPRLTHQYFEATNLMGFGLLQRNRDFNAYQDLFNLYNQVPTIWVKPRGGWGEGAVNLVELHTTYEGLDNIVAFWSPKTNPPPLTAMRFGYSQWWTWESDRSLSTNKVVGTMVGNDLTGPDRKLFAIDFSGSALFALAETNPPEAIASCGANATIVDRQVLKVPATGAWRVMLKFAPKPGNKEPVDLRCALSSRGHQLSETWTYYWNPP